MSAADTTTDEPPMVVVTCPECDGAGEWEEESHGGKWDLTGPSTNHVVCPECQGCGQLYIEADGELL